MEVVFRVDASLAIGSGHVSRCATLATMLQRQGAMVRFMCRDLPGNAVEWLRSLGLEVILLAAPVASLPTGCGEYASWLAVPIDDEIGQCQDALRGAGADWLVVDHYALDRNWEQVVRPLGARVLVIDDMANRHHACDLLLDQNYYADAALRYAGLVDGAELLTGPHYALLRPDFAACREHLRPRTGQVRKLLVFFGGSDNANVTSTVLHALDSVRDLQLQVDVVAGRANPHLDQLGQLCGQLGASLHTQVSDMALRMAQADLALGATGVATWERAALGLPTLAVSVADNQRDIASHADQIGLLRCLGDSDTVGIGDWVAALRWACSHPQALARQSSVGMGLVDGLGALRVVEKMIENHHSLH